MFNFLFEFGIFHYRNEDSEKEKDGKNIIYYYKVFLCSIELPTFKTFNLMNDYLFKKLKLLQVTKSSTIT